MNLLCRRSRARPRARPLFANSHARMYRRRSLLSARALRAAAPTAAASSPRVSGSAYPTSVQTSPPAARGGAAPAHGTKRPTYVYAICSACAFVLRSTRACLASLAISPITHSLVRAHSLSLFRSLSALLISPRRSCGCGKPTTAGVMYHGKFNMWWHPERKHWWDARRQVFCQTPTGPFYAMDAATGAFRQVSES